MFRRGRGGVNLLSRIQTISEPMGGPWVMQDPSKKLIGGYHVVQEWYLYKKPIFNHLLSLSLSMYIYRGWLFLNVMSFKCTWYEWFTKNACTRFQSITTLCKIYGPFQRPCMKIWQGIHFVFGYLIVHHFIVTYLMRKRILKVQW